MDLGAISDAVVVGVSVTAYVWLAFLLVRDAWRKLFRPPPDVTVRKGNQFYRRLFHQEDLEEMERQGLPVWKPDPKKVRDLGGKRPRR